MATFKLIGSPYQDQKVNQSGFVVIGAGLPRTGTSSMREALSIILDGGCYHMSSVFQGTSKDWDIWDRALDHVGKEKKSISNQEWIDFLQGGGYRSGVDYPISLFYKELMEAFPDAKVVLTVRDNAEGWHKSVKESIYQTIAMNAGFATSSFMKFVGRYRACCLAERISDQPPPGFKKGMFSVVGSSVEETSAFYNKWNEEVKKTVPANRLLIFNVKQGWKPLCDFLGVPVPADQPFPNVNDTKSFNSMMARIKFLGMALVYGVPLAAATVGYIFKDFIMAFLPL